MVTVRVVRPGNGKDQTIHVSVRNRYIRHDAEKAKLSGELADMCGTRCGQTEVV